MTALDIESRGEGQEVLVYLHGLNANRGVWEGLDRIAAENWGGRRVLVDLAGHGGSGPLSLYSYGAHAALVAEAVGRADSVSIIGHSMGGVIGLALASDWFGVPVTELLAHGVKVNWTAEELERAAALATKPARSFATLEEAAARFKLVSGLRDLAADDDPAVERGVVENADGTFALAADMAAGAVGAPSIQSMLAASQADVLMTCGSEDALVGIEELRPFDEGAEEWDGLGHNAQVESPESVWASFERLRARR